MPMHLKATLTLSVLVLWVLASLSCAPKGHLPDLPPQPYDWPDLVLSDNVPDDVKICVPMVPLRTPDYAFACLTFGEIRRYARSQRGG